MDWTKKVKCNVCGHEFNAVFCKKDSDANEVEYCLICGARDFRFIKIRGKKKEE